MARLTNRKSTAKGSKPYTLYGGPYNGAILWLSSGGTFAFRVNGFHGYYNSNNRWVDITS
jgi:hypothetical protein